MGCSRQQGMGVVAVVVVLVYEGGLYSFMYRGGFLFLFSSIAWKRRGRKTVTVVLQCFPPFVQSCKIPGCVTIIFLVGCYTGLDLFLYESVKIYEDLRGRKSQRVKGEYGVVQRYFSRLVVCHVRAYSSLL